jgi:SAM-dependent methyltransferase
VFEHLADPVEAAEHLWRALRPGGVLFARIHAEEDPERPHHIVRDFAPTFARLAELGLVETWRDGWLWGHQLFEKTSK